jgi:hypothetical protein
MSIPTPLSMGSRTQTAFFPGNVAVPREPRIVVPEEVDLPLPKEPGEEIAVPASINGRDLSQGKA